MNSKEAQLEKDVGFNIADESYINFRATHVWYGPFSPILNEKEPEESKYRHIFFPNKI